MSVLSALVTALLTAPFKYFQACMGGCCSNFSFLLMIFTFFC